MVIMSLSPPRLSVSGPETASRTGVDGRREPRVRVVNGESTSPAAGINIEIRKILVTDGTWRQAEDGPDLHDDVLRAGKSAGVHGQRIDTRAAIVRQIGASRRQSYRAIALVHDQ